jgi:hypothetical protein
MPDQSADQQSPDQQSKHQNEPSKIAARRASPGAVGEPYEDPQPILDASSIQEQMDRGEGMGVDDVKTYHRTEK